MDSIVLPNDFDASQVTYSSPRILDNGGKVIYMSYAGKKLLMQTPEMSAPFGVSKWNNDGKSNDKYSLDLSFKGRESREVLNKFFDGLRALDKKLVHDGMVNSQNWFKKTYKSVDVVEALYTPIIKFPKDKNGEITDKYPPTLKMTLPHDGNTFMCDVYDSAKNLVDLSSIETKGSRVSAIIQCVGIWVAGTKFGCSWKVVQMKVTPPATIKGYAFKELNDKIVDDDIEDDEDEDVKPHIKDVEDEEDDTAANGDDEEDEIEESEDELETKKVVVKKK